MPRLIIEKHHHGPALFVGQSLLPARHGRIPWRRFGRKTGTARRHAPEDIRFLQLRDRAWIDKVGRGQVEAVGEMAFAVQAVAVTVDAILKIDLGAQTDMILILSGALPQRVVQAGHLERRRRMDHPLLGGRIEAGRDTGVHAVARQHGNQHQHHDARALPEDAPVGAAQEKLADRRRKFAPRIFIDRDIDHRPADDQGHIHENQTRRQGRMDGKAKKQIGPDDEPAHARQNRDAPHQIPFPTGCLARSVSK